MAAKDAYNAALHLAPLDARTWNNRGALQEELGNLVAAELDIRRALEIDGKFEKAEANSARVRQTLLDAGPLELRPLSAFASDEGSDGPRKGAAAVPAGGLSDASGPRFGE